MAFIFWLDCPLKFFLLHKDTYRDELAILLMCLPPMLIQLRLTLTVEVGANRLMEQWALCGQCCGRTVQDRKAIEEKLVRLHLFNTERLVQSGDRHDESQIVKSAFNFMVTTRDTVGAWRDRWKRPPLQGPFPVASRSNRQHPGQ